MRNHGFCPCCARAGLTTKLKTVATTNQLIVNLQISVDGTNFLTVFTYQPSITNAQTDTYNTSSTNFAVYARAQIVTTTNTSVGVIMQQ